MAKIDFDFTRNYNPFAGFSPEELIEGENPIYSQGIGLPSNNPNLPQRGVFPIPQIKPPVSSPSPLDPPVNPLAQFRNKPTPEREAFREYLRSEPNRKDYEHGKLGKALSMIAGVAEGSQRGVGTGINTGLGLLDRPYKRAREDWESKGGRLKELADLERADIGEQKALEVAIGEIDRATDKSLREWASTYAEGQYKAAQIANMADQARKRGMTLVKNEMTGEQEWLSPDGTRTSMGKFAESIGEKTAREQEKFEREERIKHKYGVDMANLKHKQEVYLTGLRHHNDKDLAEYKALTDLKYQNLLPTQRNAAFEGAYTEVMTKYPALVESLFTTDSEGNRTLKPGYNQDVHNFYVRSIDEVVRNRLGQPSTGLSPDMDIPGMDPLTAKAVEFLATRGYTADTESINNVREQLKAQSGNITLPPNQTPPVNLPVDEYGRTMPTGQITNPAAGLFRNFGKPSVAPGQQPYVVAPQFTDLFKGGPSRTQQEMRRRGF